MGYLQQLALSEDGFLFDPTSGQSYTVSDTGLFIIKGLKQGQKEDEIARELTEAYDVNSDEARQDTLDFISHLKSHRLLQDS
jgi:PqqD family protein of HPr-rel-A system